MLLITRHDSVAMCPGNYILVILVKFVAVVETVFSEAPNTLWKWAEPTRSRPAAPWRFFMRQSTPQLRQLVLDMCLMTATISVVKTPQLCSKPSMCK
jgi:hypothetical protein